MHLPNFTSPSRLFGLALLAVLPLTPMAGQSDYSTPYSFTTFAGAFSIGSTDGPGASARFFAPAGAAQDSAGNLYVTDCGNHTIRKITSAGVVSTFAGAPGEPGSADGAGSAARFYAPTGAALDASGNLYIADSGNYTIRKITPAGIVTTLAGSVGNYGYGSSADGTGSAARFGGFPMGLAVDSAGNVYVADNGNSSIRKITPAGVVTTLAGALGPLGNADGTGSAALFSQPNGVAVDAAGNVFVADTNNSLIRKVTPGGVVTTLAGGWTYGSADGVGSSAQFFFPEAVAVDAAGNVFVGDTNNCAIRRITPAGVVSTFAGTADFWGGSSDGTGAAASFSQMRGLAIGPSGNLYVADTDNNAIRRITPAAEVTTIAGRSPTATTGNSDGIGSAARFRELAGAAVSSDGTIYVADSGMNNIRKITSAGVVTILAGPSNGSYGRGSADGIGDAARFNFPHGLAVDAAGNVFVADTLNYTIRKITPTGVVTTFAGTPGVYGNVDGSANSAQFISPQGLAFDATGNLFVSDFQWGGGLIRKITPSGVVSTYAGTGSYGYTDGDASSAQFSYPDGLACDTAGNLYIADAGNDVIRKISPAGNVTTFAGNAGQSSTTDGTGSSARFTALHGMTINADGYLFVADGNTIRRISPSGVVVTLGGLASAAGNSDGLGRAARFDAPAGIAADSSGNLYIACGSSLRKGQIAGPPTIATQPQSTTVTAGSSALFSVSANGVPAPTYQWYSNGVAIAGATSPSLTIANARSADAGNYTVVVTNPLSSVTSNSASLTVTTAPAPTTPSSGGGGGGGMLGIWFALALLTLPLLSRFTKRD